MPYPYNPNCNSISIPTATPHATSLLTKRDNSGPELDPTPSGQAAESPAAPADASYLERLTKSASRPLTATPQNSADSGPQKDQVDQPQKSDRTVRFMLQAAARQLLPSSRVAWCLRRVVPGRETVDVRYSEVRQRAYYYGLATCKALWECPICASRISERRREKLVIGLDSAPQNLYLAMLTFTISHHRGETFADVHNRLKAAYKGFWGGRWAKGFKEQFNIVGTLRALEFTHGPNGPHPHIHLLIVATRGFHRPSALPMLRQFQTQDDKDLIEAGLAEKLAEKLIEWQAERQAEGQEPTYTEEELAKQAKKAAHVRSRARLTVADEMTALVQERWQRQAGKAGAFVSQDHGVDLKFDRPALAEYVAKLESDQGWGLEAEVTKAVVKQGRGENRSLTALLYAYAYHGDEAAGRLWVEAVTSLKGQRHLMASAGFWELLGQPEQTDGELAGEDTDPCDQLLAALSLYQWREICRLEVRGYLLEVAGRGNVAALAAYLQTIGIAPESALGGQGGANRSKQGI